jgi:hypothetical protein
MKTFATSGTGSGQTLSEIESDKMPIYDSMADAEADLSNLTEGQILATKDTGDEATLKAELKTIVANSTDFADFQTNIANW